MLARAVSAVNVLLWHDLSRRTSSAASPGRQASWSSVTRPIQRPTLAHWPGLTRSGLHRQVAASVAMGAIPVLAGGPGAGPGHYYHPVILADVPPGSPAATEEMFGPVASVFAADDDEEAIRIANQTRFGLGCSVWTEDMRRAALYIASVDAGMVFVNGTVRSDARVPFGGVKDSGFGRELGPAGLREFTNAKTVWIA